MATKLVVTHGGAIEAKYGGRAEEVWNAVDALVAADEARGVQTEVIKLDAADHDATAVTDPTDSAQAKGAIDSLVSASTPDYLLLLGGPDVIPHCSLDNPTGDDDGDTLPSDLPYASDAPASTTIHDFLEATRAVSRIPDPPMASDPEPFLRALEVAAGWQTRTDDEYGSGLGITAEVWQASTALSLAQLFGEGCELHTSPDEGPGWSDEQLARRAHFVNCHGAPSTPQYFGQRGVAYPPAHDAALLDGKIAEGTVLAAECCYGAELYEPLDGQLGMPFTYLQGGAYSVFGSTTVAYGPADHNDWGDLLCRLFMSSILSGGSVGRAGVEARQAYVASCSPLDPVDLKTVAQFLVLGDPSCQAVERPTMAGPAAEAKGPVGIESRRSRLRQSAKTVGRAAAFAVPVEETSDQTVVNTIRNVAGVPGASEVNVAKFALQGGPESKGLSAFVDRAHAPQRSAMHLVVQRVENTDAPMAPQIAIVALEEGGQLTSIKTALSR